MVNDGGNILRAGDARHKKTACAVFGVELTAIERLNQRILYVEKKGIGADINKQTGTGAGDFLQLDGKALRIVKTTRTIHHMTILEIYSTHAEMRQTPDIVNDVAGCRAVARL